MSLCHLIDPDYIGDNSAARCNVKYPIQTLRDAISIRVMRCNSLINRTDMHLYLQYYIPERFRKWLNPNETGLMQFYRFNVEEVAF